MLGAYCPDMSDLKSTRKEADHCLGSGDHVGAFVRFSYALKQAEALADGDAASNHVPYILSQRSKCLLKMGNHYLALEDARRLAEVAPDSVEGHQRMAEVYYQAFHFDLAHDCFIRCFQLSPKEEQSAFMELIKACKREVAKEKAITEKYPWVGAGVGIVVSIAAVVADAVILGESSYITHPLFKVLIVIAVSWTCFWFAVVYRHFIKQSRMALLEKPTDFLGAEDQEEDQQDMDDKKNS